MIGEKRKSPFIDVMKGLLLYALRGSNPGPID